MIWQKSLTRRGQAVEEVKAKYAAAAEQQAPLTPADLIELEA